MTLKLVLDRFEENIAVCIDDDGERYLIPRSVLQDVKVDDIFNVEFENEEYHSPVVLTEETEKKKEEISSRMRKLFNLSRRRRPPKL